MEQSKKPSVFSPFAKTRMPSQIELVNMLIQGIEEEGKLKLNKKYRELLTIKIIADIQLEIYQKGRRL